MDWVDQAVETEERIHGMQLESARRAAAKLEAPVTGHCLYCGTEQTQPGRRWCDAQCRDRWERSR